MTCVQIIVMQGHLTLYSPLFLCAFDGVEHACVLSLWLFEAVPGLLIARLHDKCPTCATGTATRETVIALASYD